MQDLRRHPGDVVAVMDCDLQHPAETLIEMYQKWKEGYEVIEGVKKEIAKVENVLKQTSLYVQVNHLDGDGFNKDTVDHMVDALADDLNTSLSLTEILNQVKVLNQAMRVKEKDNTLILKEYNTLLKMTDVIGFVFKPKQLDEDELELYSKWLDAKAVKDFEKADQYREELIQKGII